MVVVKYCRRRIIADQHDHIFFPPWSGPQRGSPSASESGHAWPDWPGVALRDLSLWQQLRIKKLCAEIQEKHANAEMLYTLAMVDPLTGLYNRRFAEPRMEAEVLRAQRTGSSLTLLLADVDGLKQINDKHGHSAGDAVLRAFADRLKQATRGSDFAARLGGDEFMLLLPGCDLHQLQFVLERLRPFRIGIGGKSVGVEFCSGSSQHETGQTAEELLLAADQALYKNKRSRRPLPAVSPQPASMHLN